jgi:hypothetical protein
MPPEELEALAKVYQVLPDVSSPAAMARTAREVHLQYGLRSSMLLLLKARQFAVEKKKKFMVLLSYDSGRIAGACEGLPRPDRVLIEFLKENQFLFVDVMAKHVEDFGAFRLEPRAYVNRYFNGHYKPVGNHFFAFAIKDTVVDWLDPKPIAYRRGAESTSQKTLIDF